MINLNRPLYDYIVKNLGAYWHKRTWDAVSNLHTLYDHILNLIIFLGII